jgi:hypothetical protein
LKPESDIPERLYHRIDVRGENGGVSLGIYQLVPGYVGAFKLPMSFRNGALFRYGELACFLIVGFLFQADYLNTPRACDKPRNAALFALQILSIAGNKGLRHAEVLNPVCCRVVRRAAMRKA